MAMILRRRLSDSLLRLRPLSRAFSDSTAPTPGAAAPSDSQQSEARPVQLVPPLPVVPENSFWTTLSPSSRTVFPKDVNEYSIRDFLKCFEGFDVYHDKLARKCKTFKDFLLVRVKVLKKMKMPRNHRKTIIKFTHRKDLHAAFCWTVSIPPWKTGKDDRSPPTGLAKCLKRSTNQKHSTPLARDNDNQRARDMLHRLPKATLWPTRQRDTDVPSSQVTDVETRWQRQRIRQILLWKKREGSFREYSGPGERHGSLIKLVVDASSGR
ncbi:hypothetical protein SELMODRAFT_420912 [Selaginella moellendorffii]|uniref:Uncharacterized protein n=1 Tax=Selaginella moellendorffii TaxID=88036 RepID=D8SDI6_SELML|nr:hypothetical protein SELMODRAFT_420912 [Selaginella moellendorffii]